MNEQVKILQVLGRLDRGGAESMIMNIYRKLDLNKFQFDFVIHTNDHCDFTEEILSLGGRIYSVPKYNGKNHFIYKKWWNAFFKKHPEYKIIHGHVRSTAAIYLKIAKKYGLTAIAHSHSTSSGSGLSANVKQLMQLPIRYTANYFFACSQSAGEWLFGKQVCKKSKFKLLHNAIDTGKYVFYNEIRRNKRNELNLESKFVIGHIGRFSQPKNHSFLIDVFSSLHNQCQESVLLLVGDGGFRPQIEDKIMRLGLKNSVKFLGVRDDIPELLQAMDVFVFPSIYEGLPVVLVEAQASGIKIVASTNITDEICLCPEIEMMELSLGAKKWADKVLQFKNGYKRRNTQSEIISEGYDIISTVKMLEDFYMGICQTTK